MLRRRLLLVAVVVAALCLAAPSAAIAVAVAADVGVAGAQAADSDPLTDRPAVGDTTALREPAAPDGDGGFTLAMSLLFGSVITISGAIGLYVRRRLTAA